MGNGHLTYFYNFGTLPYLENSWSRNFKFGIADLPPGHQR